MTADFHSGLLFLYLKSVNPDNLPKFFLRFCIVLYFSAMATAAGDDASAETRNGDVNEIYRKTYKLL